MPTTRTRREPVATAAEIPVRELRNRTRDVMALVESGWTVYLTSHGRRFAEIRPTADSAAAPALSALLSDLDRTVAYESGLAQFVEAERDLDRSGSSDDPWR